MKFLYYFTSGWRSGDGGIFGLLIKFCDRGGRYVRTETKVLHRISTGGTKVWPRSKLNTVVGVDVICKAAMFIFPGTRP